MGSFKCNANVTPKRWRSKRYITNHPIVHASFTPTKLNPTLNYLVELTSHSYDANTSHHRIDFLFHPRLVRLQKDDCPTVTPNGKRMVLIGNSFSAICRKFGRCCCRCRIRRPQQHLVFRGVKMELQVVFGMIPFTRDPEHQGGSGCRRR